MCGNWPRVVAIMLLVAAPAVGQEPARPSVLDVPPPVEFSPTALNTLETVTGVRGEGREERPESRGRDEIETDRDSFTPSVRTAGRGRLIIESAYTFQDNRGIKETHSFPELLLRYGVADRVELRLGWNYEVGGTGNEISGSGSDIDTATAPHSRSGLERIYRMLYGVKIGLTEQDGWRPESAVILQGYTPTGGDVTATQFVGSYVFGWELPRRSKLDAGIRYGTASNEGDRFNQWAPSVVLKVPLGEKWSVHSEYFGIFSTGRAKETNLQYVSPGVHYLVTPDFEVGVRLGWGLNDQSARFFMNAGIGWRI